MKGGESCGEIVDRITWLGVLVSLFLFSLSEGFGASFSCLIAIWDACWHV